MQDIAKQVTQEGQQEGQKGNDIRVMVGGQLAAEFSVNSAVDVLTAFIKKILTEQGIRSFMLHPVETSKNHPLPIAEPIAEPSNIDGDKLKENKGSASRVKRLIGLFAFASILIILFLYASGGYLENYKSQASAAANHEMAMLSSAAYDKILALHLDELLKNLEELTSIDRFGKAFPDITIMHAAALTKRGPGDAEKSRSALEFIRTTKGYFDTWTARPNDWTAKLKPTEEDIAVFLSIWEGTEVLLDRLQEAQNDPLGFLIEKAQLPTS